MKEGDSKAPSFSRDLCEIPAMPRVKKKTALAMCQPLLPLRSPSPFPPFFVASHLKMEMAGAASLHRWKSPVFRGTEKKERPRRTDLDRPALEVICRDTVINANRKIAGMTGLEGRRRGGRFGIFCNVYSRRNIPPLFFFCRGGTNNTGLR